VIQTLPLLFREPIYLFPEAEQIQSQFGLFYKATLFFKNGSNLFVFDMVLDPNQLGGRPYEKTNIITDRWHMPSLFFVYPLLSCIICGDNL
jgi:hypothetical protein